VRIEVEYLKGRGALAKMHGVAKVNDAVVCEGDLMCTISPTSTIKSEDPSDGIHKTAVIHPSAKIGQNVKIGAYTVIGPEVNIGNNTEIDSNVLIAKYATIGSNCKILHGTTIGTAPQDFKYKGERNEVVIGDNTVIREFCSIHLPTGEGKVTSIGSNCMLMTNVHIPHNAKIGNNVIISSFVGLAGHAEVGDFVIIGGMTGVHQFVRIGKMAMIGGSSRISQDVPPFMLAEGNPAQVKALNSIGLQRRGVPFESQVELKKAFKILYKSHHNLSQALGELKKHCKMVDEIKLLIEFLEKETDRGILKRSETNDDLLFPDIPELGI
jgi:UDP-N-acetylglucosamine acyltransferase